MSEFKFTEQAEVKLKYAYFVMSLSYPVRNWIYQAQGHECNFWIQK